jgi:hypothetical protein
MTFCRFSCLLAALLVAPALFGSSLLFDFNSFAPDTTTTFSSTVGGVTATFSSNCTFYVEPYAIYSGLPLSTGNDLTGEQSASICTLNIAFSQPATGVSLKYGYDFGNQPFGPQFYLTSTEYSGGLSGTQTGTQTLHGAKAGTNYATGTLTFTGSLDALKIQNPRSVADFTIDDITYNAVTPAPEPAAALLAIAGFAVLLARRRVSR